MLQFPVALQLFSVREDMEADFYGTLKKVKDMGYDGVEFAGLYGKSPTEVRQMCEEIGLVPVSAHVSFPDPENPESVIVTYKEIGCKQIVIPSLAEEYRPGSEGFTEFVRWVKKLGAVCKNYNMKLAYHNHTFEFDKIDDEYVLDILYREVPADCLETQIDTCWVFVGGENPADYVRKYAGREYTVHLKDFWLNPDFTKGKKCEQIYQLIGIDNGKQTEAEVGQDGCLRPVGYGVQNFGVILEAAKEAGVEWVIVEQDDPSMNKTSLQCAQLSLEYLKTL